MSDATVREALLLAQSALRRWTNLYAHLQNECGEVVSRKLDYNLPPAEHVKALEAIDAALQSLPSTAAMPSEGSADENAAANREALLTAQEIVAGDRVNIHVREVRLARALLRFEHINAMLRELLKAKTSPSSRGGNTFHVCQDHTNADWNQPELDDEACVLCRLFYLEAQESLLEEWQQRAKKAEDAIAEIQRPLDAQMARLNETVARLNEENERLRQSLSSTGEGMSNEERYKRFGTLLPLGERPKETDAEIVARSTAAVASGETPRTDAAEYERDAVPCGWVWSDFARQLERELAEAKSLQCEDIVGCRQGQPCLARSAIAMPLWVPVSERLPEVKLGEEEPCWVAAKRDNGKVYVYLSWWVNRPKHTEPDHEHPWEVQDEDGEPLDCVGWHTVGCNRHYDDFFMPEEEAEQIFAWMPVLRPAKPSVPPSSTGNAIK